MFYHYPMTTKKAIYILPVIFFSMACAFVQNMIFPPSPTPTPTASPTPLPPTVTPIPPTATAIFEAACPDILKDIIKAATKVPIRLGKEEDPVRFLVRYTIKDSKLGQRHDDFVPDELKSQWDARAKHQEIWEYFKALIPEEEQGYVTEFSIFSDGRDDILGAVSPVPGNLSKWELKVDIVDAGDPDLLTFTLIHEFGHLITLNSKQVALDQTLFYNPDNKDMRERAIDACPQYFTGMGCSQSESYINEFFNRYWTDLYPEWQKIDREKDSGDRHVMLDDFYKTYKDQFVTKYAATQPPEDIAESWTLFVLSPKPETNSIADQKILFFYEYPELVAIRQEILTRLCAAFPR